MDAIWRTFWERLRIRTDGERGVSGKSVLSAWLGDEDDTTNEKNQITVGIRLPIWVPWSSGAPLIAHMENPVRIPRMLAPMISDIQTIAINATRTFWERMMRKTDGESVREIHIVSVTWWWYYRWKKSDHCGNQITNLSAVTSWCALDSRHGEFSPHLANVGTYNFRCTNRIATNIKTQMRVTNGKMELW